MRFSFLIALLAIGCGREVAQPPIEVPADTVSTEVFDTVIAESKPSARITKDTPVKVPAVIPPPAPSKENYRRISFELLSGFPYIAGDSIPSHILVLDGKKVRIQGFMLPTVMDGSNVVAFLVTVDQEACCFGVSPSDNGWVAVRMKPGTSAPYLADIPIFVEGTLSIKQPREGESYEGLYHISADRAGSLFS